MTIRSRLRSAVYRHIGGTALVLIYHRVATLERDPQMLAVSPERFDEQMALLARDYQVVSVAELAESLRRRSVPNRAVAVTFDDGYADNLHAMEPIVRNHGVQATVFVSSGYVGGDREFWWDEAERLILGPGIVPESLALVAGDRHFMAAPGRTLTRTPDQALADRGWNMASSDTDPRHGLYRDVCAFLRPLSRPAREAALEQLRAALGAAPEVRPTHRQLTTAELVQLDRSEHVDIGGHTVNHVLMAERPEAEQREEVFSDRAELSRVCGHGIAMFSYPYGGYGDYTDESAAIARDVGYSAACANHWGVVKPWTDPFRIPRNLVREWDAAEFRNRIEGWLHDPR